MDNYPGILELHKVRLLSGTSMPASPFEIENRTLTGVLPRRASQESP
jgi:hypothetical protein